MLVLSRKTGESVEMSNGITVRVLRGKRNEVVLGFDAPKEINIWREELKEIKHRATDV